MRVSFEEIVLVRDQEPQKTGSIVPVRVEDARRVAGMRDQPVSAVLVDGFGWIKAAGAEAEVREKLEAAGWAGDDKGEEK